MAESPGDRHDRPQPSGREEIMEAIIAASTELFAEKGPARVTVRDIAARAGVPHSVVFRYFGDKQSVLLEVLKRGSAIEVASFDDPALATPEAKFQAGLENRAYRVATIQAMLDGLRPDQIPGGLPELHRTLDLIEARGPLADGVEPRFDPRVVVAFLAAATVGWDVTEGFYMQALGLDPSELDSVRSQIVAMMMMLLDHTEA